MKIYRLLAMLLLSPPLWAAQTLNIQNLNRKIHNAGADWVAGETSVSHLSRKEMQSMLGVGIDPHPDVVFSTPETSKLSVMAVAKQPVALDWRNFNGQNWVTPIKNQGACGSCVAFATVATFETQYRITAKNSSLPVNLSTQYLFSCGGGKCQVGWWPEKAAAFLKAKGTTDESCFPYASGQDGKDVACNLACPNAAKKTWRIANSTTPTRQVMKIAAIKTALQTGPLVTTLSVYRDFAYYKSGIYKRVSDEYWGGHAVSIVGYDDVNRALIIRNSWGPNWGEDGFARISYDDTSGVGASTWKYTVRPTKVYAIPSLNTLADQEDSAEEDLPSAAVADNSPVDTQPGLSTQWSQSPGLAEASIEMTSAHAFVEIKMHQKLRGHAERVIQVPVDEEALHVQIKTAQWKKGEWEVYFVGRNPQDPSRDLVESEHYFLNVRSE